MPNASEPAVEGQTMESSSKRAPVRRVAASRRGGAGPRRLMIVLATVLPAGRVARPARTRTPRVSPPRLRSRSSASTSSVTGKDGRPVHGLSAADFEVLHGGKPVAITNFHEERDLEPVPGASGRWTAPAGGVRPPQRRPRVCAASHRRLRRPALPPGAATAGSSSSTGSSSFLARALGPGDEAMVVSWGDSMRIVRSFTGDLEELEATIDAVARGPRGMGSEAAELDELAARDFWFERGRPRTRGSVCPAASGRRTSPARSPPCRPTTS